MIDKFINTFINDLLITRLKKHGASEFFNGLRGVIPDKTHL